MRPGPADPILDSMADGRVRGPYKRGGEKGTNRPGSDNTPFVGARAEKYLEVLRETGLRVLAREAANVLVQTVKALRDRDPDFASAEQEALELHHATIEREIHRRGVEGVQRAIYYEGTVVGWETVYSDQLLLHYAKSKIDSYKDKVHVDQNTNHSGGVAVGLADLSKLSPDGRALLRQLLEKERGKPEA